MLLHFEKERFFHAIIWLTISSLLIFQQNSYILMERIKNIFPYLQLINFVVWAHGNDQLRRIITLEHLLLKVPLKCLWVVRMWNCLYHPDMNGLDNATIMNVLSWNIKFSVNGKNLSRKSSPKFYFY